MAGDTSGRRPVPTIDLTASEVEPDKPAEPAPSTSAAPGEAARPEPQEEVSQPAEAADGPTDSSSSRTTWLNQNLLWSIGPAVLALILLGGWAYVVTTRADALAARLAGLEAQLREVGRPNLDNRIDELGTRLARAEAAAAQPAGDPALTARLVAAENATKSLADTIASLNRRIEEVASATREARTRAEAAAGQTQSAAAIEQHELEALAGRIAALEQAAKTVQAELARRAGAADRAARLAVAAAALKSAVERGDPFVAELAAAKPLAGDRLAPLEPFARAGVPSVAALTRELQELTPALLPTGSAKAQGGFLERMQANAERLVRIRPVGETAGDDAVAIVARIESRAVQADLAGALAELRKLPPERRAPAEAWIRKVEARMDAIEVSRRLVAESMDALGKS